MKRLLNGFRPLLVALATALLFGLCFLLVRSVFAAEKESKTKIMFNGSFLRLERPVLVDTDSDRLLIPLRPTLESLGVSADDIFYDATAGFLYFENFLGHSIAMYIGDDVATVDGARVELDTPARVVDEFVYIPLRFVAESLGADVEWDEKEQLVTIILE